MSALDLKQVPLTDAERRTIFRALQLTGWMLDMGFGIKGGPDWDHHTEDELRQIALLVLPEGLSS